MRLLRYGNRGAERPGILDEQSHIRDLSSVLDDITPADVSADQLRRLAKIDPHELPLVNGSPRIGTPLSAVGTFFAIGLNYADHAMEAGLRVPSEPIFFIKAGGCVSGPNDPIILPKGSMKSDWEVELAVVIGRTASYIAVERALDYVAGYVLVNDVSERSFQNERGSQWAKGKGCDTFGPIGPWLVTPDEIADPQDLDMWLNLNGEPMQRGNTSTMIFSVAALIAYVSHFTTLRPGDVLTTGTPAGVGEGRTPPRFMRPGDSVELGVGLLGEQHHKVAGWAGR